MAKNNGNPFDTIAKKADSKSKTNKVPADVSPEVKKAVDDLIKLKAEKAALDQTIKETEDTIVQAVRPQQIKLAQTCKYSKSFSVMGNKGEVTYTTSDRFTVPKEGDAQTALKDFLGARTDEVLETKREIVLKKEAAENKALIAKIMTAIEKAGVTIGDVFEVTDTTVTTKDMDERQFQLFKPEELPKWWSFVSWWKPAIK